MIRLIAATLTIGALLSACSQPAGITPASPPAALARSFGAPTGASKVHWFGSNLPWPEVITKGPDGNLWFTEFYTEQVARITPAGVITQFNLPNMQGSSEGITTGRTEFCISLKPLYQDFGNENRPARATASCT